LSNLLILICLFEVFPYQELINLPIEPQGSVEQQLSVFFSGVGRVREEFVGIFTIGQVENPQLDLPLVCQISNFADRSYRSIGTSSIGIKVKDTNLLGPV
jgi:hypothetical protein